MPKYILALDQGTTSSRAMLFDQGGHVIAAAQQELPQILPAPGLVEHDPEAIWSTQLEVARQAMAQAKLTTADLAAVGVTNQREPTILWERASGRPVANAVVWQSRLSAPVCERLKADGLEETFRAKTGLVIDAYFSGTKIKHLLDNHEGLRARAERGEILFGNVDTWLIWRLSGGRRHVTDLSNASRTLLFNIHTRGWDEELLRILDVPRAMLPEVRSSSELYATTAEEWLGGPVPITGDAGDQQAAAFGQACFAPGSAKNTYGTGCFLLMNTGGTPVPSRSGLLTTIGWGLGGEVTYCLEGSIFIGGAVVQWLRDGLGVIPTAAEVERLAAGVADSGGVVFVPAFVGLGAPRWDPYARGTILGITRGTTAGHLARAALEAIAQQTCDVLEVMRKDADVELSELKADGGASLNSLLMQCQADLLGIPVRRPVVAETTALGAAYLAGLAIGYWHDTDEIARNWALDCEYRPTISAAARQSQRRLWQKAVQRTLDWAEH